MKKAGITVGLAVVFILKSFSQQPAFPGAEGFGKYAAGGRGGIVVEVTNLADEGPGSLRQALTTNTNQKRTVVFRVSGTIELESPLKISNDSCITIAGQTAPGDGICLKNYPLFIENSHNIIVRYLRMRAGDQQDCVSPNCDDIDATSVRTSYNIILDHCSYSWSIDACLDLTHETGQSTVQYCILSEALLNSKHSKGAHSMAAGWDGQGGATYHHNLIVSCNSRTPRLDSYLGQISGERDLIEIANNVIYNWAGYGAYGGENADVNWQNNYYRYGPSTGGSTGGKKDQIYQVDGSCKLFLDGNYVEWFPLVTEDNSKGIYIKGRRATQTELDTTLMTVPFVVESIDLKSTEETFNIVLAEAGASLPKRDPVDTRIVSDVNLLTGSLIDSPAEVGGWPDLISTAAPVDTDHDGMPDDWELAEGLNINDPADRNLDRNGNGYTNLEDYLNSIVTNIDIIYRPADITLVRNGNYGVTINWKDNSENENSFVIERSDGSDFIEIATTNANDTVHKDTVPAYAWYSYRVKAINNDRESLYGYSEKIYINELSSSIPENMVTNIVCFPNPFDQFVYINFEVLHSDPLNIFVCDISGKLIRMLNSSVRLTGSHAVYWDGKDENGNTLPSGAYLIYFKNASGTISRKIIKQ